MPADLRALRIALATSRELPYAAALQLAASIERWAEEPPSAALAASLAVPPRHLAYALALREAAPELAARQTECAARHGARLVVPGDPDFPAPLLDLDLPPPTLHFRGTQPPAAAVAIVGSRRADGYALEVAHWLGRELAAAGLLVVSGFARGVDAAAHRGALAAPQGTTVAVLGCGLDCNYPKEHAELAREIAGRGALATEFPCGTPPEAWRFPVRNRLIAAWARATVVVAAAPRSGSLVTARLALDLGREVFAVPGRILDELALGTNALVRDGATPLLHPDDLLAALGHGGRGAARPETTADDAGEARDLTSDPLRAALAGGVPRSVETLVAAAGVPPGEVLSRLLELELTGAVERLPGPAYRLRR